jgi:DNA-binding CsgD family transcriptional regulator
VERLARTRAHACGLTNAESDLLRRSALGESRSEIADARGTSEHTIKTQIARLLHKTGDGSLHEAVERLLREVAHASD